MLNQPIFSVILLSYNNRDLLKQCVESIFEAGKDMDYELIIVDNASHQETLSYLKTIEGKCSFLKIIFLSENIGYAAGNNIGLREARGKYFVLLNNDTKIFPGFFSFFQKIFEKNEKIGLLGPVSNNVSTNQLVLFPPKREKYQSLCFLHKLSFFCVALRATVYHSVGEFDEGYTLGMFEDDDYCERVSKAGFLIAYTKNVFVWHKGSATISRLNFQEYHRLWQKNRLYFEKKWNRKWKADISFLTFLKLLWLRRTRLFVYFQYAISTFKKESR